MNRAIQNSMIGAPLFVGETVTVVEAISNGRGRVKVGDGVWIAKGPDAAVGKRNRQRQGRLCL